MRNREDGPGSETFFVMKVECERVLPASLLNSTWNPFAFKSFSIIKNMHLQHGYVVITCLWVTTLLMIVQTKNISQMIANGQ